MMYATARLVLVLAAAVVAHPAPVAAQTPFEGVITAVITGEGERTQQTISVKGNMWRADMTVEGDRVAIIRGRDGRVLSVSTAERMYSVIPDPGGEDAPMRYTALDRSETVAGMSCRYYRITDPNGLMDGDEVCVTTALGFVGFTPVGSLSPADERALRSQFGSGFMILKLREPDGGMQFEVTRVERRSVGDDVFTPPAGYREFRRPGMR